MDNIYELDFWLLQTIKYLIKNWYQKDVGIVACAIKDHDKVAINTSIRNGRHWLHAERNAYRTFQKNMVNLVAMQFSLLLCPLVSQN